MAELSFHPRDLSQQVVSSSTPHSGDQLSKWLVCAPLVVTTLLAKFSVPPFGTQGLGVSYPLLLIIFSVGIFTGRIGLHAGRTAYFATFVGFIGMVQILREEPFSSSAIVLLAVSSAMYILSVLTADTKNGSSLEFVARYSKFFAVLGILQFLAQLVVGSRYAFPIESFLPEGFLISGFHNLNPLYYGSTIYKSNGIFLLEPSFFSQLMAIGLIAELSTRKRFINISTLTLALLFSYSGTGILILAVALPIFLLKERRLDLLFAIVGVVFFAGLFATPLKLDSLVNRIGEFTAPNSSAYIRFVGWYYLAQDALGHDWTRAFFGYGAGTFREVSSQFRSPTAEVFHAKILIEYGLLGFFGYLGYLAYCIGTSPVPIAMKWALFVMIFMAGAFAEPVTGLLLTTAFLSNRTIQEKNPKGVLEPKDFAST